jgi:hypothetical protein
MSLATSFPAPVSLWIKTAGPAAAIPFTSAGKARNFGLDPIKARVVITFPLVSIHDASETCD